jgi:hypothetical protein
MHLILLFKTSLPLLSKTRTPFSLLGDRDPQWKDPGSRMFGIDPL